MNLNKKIAFIMLNFNIIVLHGNIISNDIKNRNNIKNKGKEITNNFSLDNFEVITK